MPETAFDRTIFRRGDVVYGYDISLTFPRKAEVRVVHITESEKGITVQYHLDPLDGMPNHSLLRKGVRKFPQALADEHVFGSKSDADAYMTKTSGQRGVPYV